MSDLRFSMSPDIPTGYVEFQTLDGDGDMSIVIDGTTSTTKVYLDVEECRELRNFLDLQLEQYDSTNSTRISGETDDKV